MDVILTGDDTFVEVAQELKKVKEQQDELNAVSEANKKIKQDGEKENEKQ